MDDNIKLTGIEKRLINRCDIMEIKPPACYYKKDGAWYRSKEIPEEYKQERHTCYQMALLDSIRRLLLWLIWLPIVGGILLLLF